MSFWDILWFIIITYAFFAYLMMLFWVVRDIFRDHDLSGFTKALWLIALLFVPFLSLLVYLIVRGKGMAERSAASHEAAQREQETYIKNVAGANSPADQIAKARAMLDDGTISQTEFDTLKAKALAA
jgi:type VI protein secretion system component VasK